MSDELIPRLRGARIRYVDKDGYLPARPRLDEMDRCITRSRWTVLVLTRAFLEDRWESSSGLLSQSFGLDEGRWRTIPVVVEPRLELPRRLEQLVAVDLTARDEAEWSRLVRVLAPGGDAAGAPAAEREESESRAAGLGSAYAVNKALRVLVDLLWEPAVRGAVGAFRNDFQAACEQIDALGDYKELHDLLHEVQYFYKKLFVREMPAFPEDATSCENLVEHEIILEKIIARSREVAGRGKASAGAISWVRELVQAHAHLHAANESLDAAELEKADRRLKRVLGATNASQINSLLAQTARVLRLPQLEEAMVAVRGVLDQPDLDPEKVHLFDDGVRQLGSLKLGLQATVAEHDRWQEVDGELRLMETSLGDDPELLSDLWSDLHAMVAPLAAGEQEWAAQLRAEAQALSEAISGRVAAGIRKRFLSFRGKADLRFFQVDRELLKLCEELRTVGTPLAKVMEIAR